MVSQEASVASWKRELVQELQEKFEKYPVVGILDIQGIPAPQFQQMRDLLRGKAEIKVSRRVLLQIAIEERSEEDPELEELAEHLEGPSALIFTEMNPFKLWKLLEENRTTAPAKPGMESPRDIVIPEGDTEFDPGPVVGELQSAGVKARIQAGKVVVLEDSTIVKEGEEISEEEVQVMSRFGIEPREIGFEVEAAYEDGVVFSGDMLEIDEEETRSDLENASTRAMALSMSVKYPTRQNINSIVAQGHSEALTVATEGSVIIPETVSKFLKKASTEMYNLASAVSSEEDEALDEELSSKLSDQSQTAEMKTKRKSLEKNLKKNLRQILEDYLINGGVMKWNTYMLHCYCTPPTRRLPKMILPKYLKLQELR